jgi:ribosomal protein S27AE
MENEIMFCPDCGKSEQIVNTYCRNCGVFLADANKLSRLSFGGISPQQNVRTINILSFAASIISLLSAIWMYATRFNIPVVLYLGAVILLCNAAWHFSNLVIGMKLKKRLNQAGKMLSETEKNLPKSKVQEFLPQADTNQFIEPPSIIENTTKILPEKIKTRSS